MAQPVHKSESMLNETENPNLTQAALRAIASKDFIKEVLRSDQPVLVEFCTAWSRPCHVIDSVLEQVARNHVGKLKVLKVDADECLDLSLVYDIESVPTVLCFVQGNPEWRIVGTASSDAIENRLEPFLP